MSNPADELAIRQLVAEYIDAVNRYQGEDWIATWSDDAVWFLMGMEVTGREDIFNLWKGAMSTFEFAIMMLNSGTVTVDGDSAHGRWYVTEHPISRNFPVIASRQSVSIFTLRTPYLMPVTISSIGTPQVCGMVPP